MPTHSLKESPRRGIVDDRQKKNGPNRERGKRHDRGLTTDYSGVEMASSSIPQPHSPGRPEDNTLDACPKCDRRDIQPYMTFIPEMGEVPGLDCDYICPDCSHIWGTAWATAWPTRPSWAPRHTTSSERVALIHSITGHAQGREDQVLKLVQGVLNGATLEQLAEANRRGAL